MVTFLRAIGGAILAISLVGCGSNPQPVSTTSLNSSQETSSATGTPANNVSGSSGLAKLSADQAALTKSKALLQSHLSALSAGGGVSPAALMTIAADFQAIETQLQTVETDVETAIQDDGSQADIAAVEADLQTLETDVEQLLSDLEAAIEAAVAQLCAGLPGGAAGLPGGAAGLPGILQNFISGAHP